MILLFEKRIDLDLDHVADLADSVHGLEELVRELGDVAEAINTHAMENGFSVVREIGGHGVGLLGQGDACQSLEGQLACHAGGGVDKQVAAKNEAAQACHYPHEAEPYVDR